MRIPQKLQFISQNDYSPCYLQRLCQLKNRNKQTNREKIKMGKHVGRAKNKKQNLTSGQRNGN